MTDDVYELRADLDAALARVKELGSALMRERAAFDIATDTHNKDMRLLDAANARVKELEAEILKTRAEASELTKQRDPNINSALRDLGEP